MQGEKLIYCYTNERKLHVFLFGNVIAMYILLTMNKKIFPA